MKKVFITGSSNGQLHWELCRTIPADVNRLLWPERLDICNAQQVSKVIQQLQPDIIINTAAYTAVDKAEAQAAAAYATNQSGVENLAIAANLVNARLIHISTDFVFGEGGGSPLANNASTKPVNIYGKSKLAGEQALQRLMPGRHTIVRTSWVYSSNGSNFVKTILRLLSERDELGVVADQIGTPTWAHSLALALWRAENVEAQGILHWTGAGVASWYDFAVAIYEEAKAAGLIDKEVNIKPLTTEQYPTPAARPHYSVLQCQRSWSQLEMQPQHWRVDLRRMLKELK